MPRRSNCSKINLGGYKDTTNTIGMECLVLGEGYAFDVLGALLYFSDGFSYRAQCCLQRVSEHLYDGEAIQIINDGPDGYEKVMFALQLAQELWTGYEPTAEELSMPLMKLIGNRMLSS